MNIINHLEKHLGEIETGWKHTNASSEVSIVRFINQPVDGLSTYTTFGTSHHKLSLANNKEIRQELIFTALNNIPSGEISSFLLRMSDLVLSKHEGFLRGQVIGPGEQLFSGSSMNAVYATMPVLFSEGLAIFEGSSPSTVMVWLIPIYADETKYIDELGWEEFENILEPKDPDLWDLNRPSVID